MKSIKILAFGNSYSNDAYAWLYLILKSAGYDEVVLGHISNGGCNINNHWSNVDDDVTNDYNAWCSVNDNGTGRLYAVNESLSLRDAYRLTIAEQEWDYVVIQHGPNHVQVRETYSHLRDLLDFIKENLTSKKAKFIYHMVWKYNDTVAGGSTAAFYDDIIDITKNIVLKNEEFTGVIPAATMRQNIMTSHLTDKDIARDYGHMSLGLGRYALGLLWYCYLTGGDIDRVSFVPSSNDVSPELLEKFAFDNVTKESMDIVKEAIANAIESPFKITKSKFSSRENEPLDMDEMNIDEHIAAVGGEHLE